MDLFQDEETQALSPRLQWMEKHKIRTMVNRDKTWTAYRSETRFTFAHENEIDAIIGLAKNLKIKLWNES